MKKLPPLPPLLQTFRPRLYRVLRKDEPSYYTDTWEGLGWTDGRVIINPALLHGVKDIQAALVAAVILARGDTANHRPVTDIMHHHMLDASPATFDGYEKPVDVRGAVCFGYVTCEDKTSLFDGDLLNLMMRSRPDALMLSKYGGPLLGLHGNKFIGMLMPIRFPFDTLIDMRLAIHNGNYRA